MVIAAAVAALLAVGGCASGADGDGPTGLAQSGEVVVQGLPAGHVHGIGRDPGSGQLYVASHVGLFVYDSARSGRKVGPTIDLMGFTVAGPGRLLASGHPGEGSDLPQPVGLIESTDGGQSWDIRSRGGQSDFHALAASGGSIVGYDGELRGTSDGRTWQDLPTPAPVIAAAGSPDGLTFLISTTAGLHLSTDRGQSWDPVPGAPPVALLDWADGKTVAGVDARGAVFLSRDDGRTWSPTAAAPLGEPQAVGAGVQEGALEILVVTGEAILRSTDAGASFSRDW